MLNSDCNSMVQTMRKATIFAGDFDESPSEDAAWVRQWLEKWGADVVVVQYSTGGWEHIWDVLGPEAAIDEIPAHLLCTSEWASEG